MRPMGKATYAVVDVGTTNIKLLLYDEELNLLHLKPIKIGLLSAGPGRFEQDSETLFKAVRSLVHNARDAGARLLGIATYRASVVAWKRDGTPITNIVTWMDERGREVLKGLPPHLKLIAKIPPLSAAFSPKTPVILYRWLIDNVRGLRERLRRGEAYIGTLDSYLIYRMTGRHLSDVTNAALTGLVDPRRLSWIGLVRRLLGLDIPLPRLMDSVDEYGEFHGLELRSVIADQQAAAIGECCLERGKLKVTLGTGTFVDMCTGGETRLYGGGLVPLIILKIGGRVLYGIEGFIPGTGPQIDWMIEVGLLRGYEELDELTPKAYGHVPIFIPALSGMRTPELPPSSGMFWGLSLKTGRRELIRAVLEGVTFGVRFVLDMIREKTGIEPSEARVDGGLSRSQSLLEIIAEVIGLPVLRQEGGEMTGRGVAMLLALSENAFSLEDLAQLCEFKHRVEPPPMSKDVARRYAVWRRLLMELGRLPS